MIDRLSLRTRFALFFAGLAAGGVVATGAGAVLGYMRAGGPLDGYVIAWLIGSFGIAGLAVWVGFLFDENVARPILALAADLHTRATSDVSAAIDKDPAKYLGTLAPAAEAIHDALEEARASQAQALADKTARMARDKALLEALIRDLPEGVVVVSPLGQVLLHNRAAVDILGPLGLDRPAARFLKLDPVTEAAGRAGDAPALFLTATADGTRLLTGTVSPIGTQDDEIGQLLLFHDASEDLRTHAHLDGLLSELIDQARRPAMALGALLDVSEVETEASDTRLVSAMRAELHALSTSVRHSAEEQAKIGARHWPIEPTTAQSILDGLAARHQIDIVPSEVPLTCDAYAVSLVLSRVVTMLARETRDGITLSVEADDTEARLVLTWSGPALSQAQLETEMEQPLSDAYGPYTGQAALRAHRTDIWVEGVQRVVLPLPRAGIHAPQTWPDRPDFYNFDLGRSSGAGQLLRELPFVVFDTETTGLDPNSDEMVQIAGVRIVDGRVIRGEQFDCLVHPGRSIPPSSTEIHHITDAMVADAPPVTEACLKFADFAEGAVLVAHHAQFDMAFLKRVEAAGGATFNHPVLCTGLLSQKLHSHTGEHTLDALAERYGVTIEEAVRHTALGDAQATAEVFLKMLPLLEAAGVRDLAQAQSV